MGLFLLRFLLLVIFSYLNAWYFHNFFITNLQNFHRQFCLTQICLIFKFEIKWNLLIFCFFLFSFVTSFLCYIFLSIFFFAFLFRLLLNFWYIRQVCIFLGEGNHLIFLYFCSFNHLLYFFNQADNQHVPHSFTTNSPVNVSYTRRLCTETKMCETISKTRNIRNSITLTTLRWFYSKTIFFVLFLFLFCGEFILFTFSLEEIQ